MNIEELTKEIAFSYNVDIHPWNKEGYNGFIAGAEWERNRNKWISGMPEFDGRYLACIEHSQECGNVHVIQEVVECSMNRWLIDPETETVIGWQPLPEPPKEEKK